MRLFLLTALTMIAFAANSVLNRMALAGGSIDAVSFGVIRLVSGAVILAALCLMLGRGIRLGGAGRVVGVIALLVYLYGFSTAYRGLDAGMGALILFGVVQITMFSWGLIRSEKTPLRRWIGAAMAFVGLIWILWPGPGASVSLTHGLLMALAGVAWGAYSLAGQLSRDALQGTTANFLIAAPVCAIVGYLMPAVEPILVTSQGIVLAVICGAVTSGLGYALWYSVLPSLASSVAAVAQLTVPVIATLGGMVFLSETLSVQFMLASVLVLGGVAVSISARGPGRRS